MPVLAAYINHPAAMVCRLVEGGELQLHLFGGAKSDLEMIASTDVVDDHLIERVAPNADRPRQANAPQRNDRDLGCARTTIDQHPTARFVRSEEHTSELQSLMRISYAVFCLKKK